MNAIKRFLGNKNTVTIIGVILGVIVLYIGYNWRVNQAVTPVRIPIAKKAIGSRELITEDHIAYVEVSKKMTRAQKNLVTNASGVVGMRVAYGTSIAPNSPFYSEMLMTEAEMPDSAFANIPDGFTIYSLGVNLHTTYGNSIFPGNYIDLYIKATDDINKVIYGKLIESIEVLAVKDSRGQHVFESTVETRQPSELLFAVPDDMYLLLMKAEYVSSVQLINPVPRNASYSADPGDTFVSGDYIRDFILSKTVILPE